MIVIGVGAMGAATCDQLARRGVSVLGLERYDIPHALGSSGGQSRLIRLAYYEHPDYVPLLRRAYQNWDTLAERVGEPILIRAGCLYLGRPEGHLIAGVLRAAGEHRLEVESLDARQLSERYDPFRVPEGFAALFEGEAGFLLCERVIGAFAELALRAGAELHAREPVLSWSSDARGVHVATARGEYDAGHLVLAAGAWTPQLARELGARLKVSRQVIGWVWPTPPERFELGRFPCWAIQDDAPGFEGIYYGFPLLPVDRFPGERGLKLAHHSVGPTAEPDRLDREVSLADEEDFRPALRKYLPGADGPTLAAKVCMYTNTPDETFIVDRHPTAPNVTVACGMSGHGFKFASVIGEALADLAINGRTDLPIDFLRLKRFGV